MEIDTDMSQFHDIFFEEAIEGIGIMEKELLNLNSDVYDNETINVIFRAAHSIKGSAGTFGFEDIGKFTHSIETILDMLRNETLTITQEIISALLSSVDCLNNMLAREKAGESHDVETNKSIAKQLDAFLLFAGGETLPEVQHGEQTSTDDRPLDESNNDSDRKWRISFFPNKRLFYTGNDPLRLLRELQTLGTLTVEAVAGSLPDLDNLDVHNCYLGWRIELQGNVSQEEIEEVFTWVEGDCKLTIHEEVDKRIEPDRRDNLNGGERRKLEAKNHSIRVDTDKVDELLNLVSELVITQSILNSIHEAEGLEISEKLEECLEQLERNTRELQEHTMSIRMLPVNNAFQRIPRIVRDLSIAQGKKVTLELAGKTTELDKTILEKIVDPLMHLVRNAIDHGIESPQERIASGKYEQGIINIKATHEGGYIVLRISDDGRGIDPDKILDQAINKNIVSKDDDLDKSEILNLIFQPGFSTAEVISDISGRGVGMDVVKQNIMDLGGVVEIWSEKGIGSTFTIKLPLTLAILDGQIVKVGNETFIIPLHSISETLVFDEESANTVTGETELYQYRDKYIPVIRLKKLFNIKPDEEINSEADALVESGLLVIVNTEKDHAGILVDDVIGQQQVVIKSLEKNYNAVPGVAGATILGNGSVALILDVLSLGAHSIKSADLLHTV